MDTFWKELKVKLMSRKFQALVVGTVAFFATDRFSDTSLLTLLGVYIGANTLQKFAGIRGNTGGRDEQ